MADEPTAPQLFIRAKPRRGRRAEQWKADLRAEPKVARLLLRRLVGPLTLWDAAEPSSAWIDCEASVTPALLDGLVDAVHHVASPTGTSQDVRRVRGRLRRAA